MCYTNVVTDNSSLGVFYLQKMIMAVWATLQKKQKKKKKEEKQAEKYN